MSFKARRLSVAALVMSLLIQMEIAENGYASRRTKIAFTSVRDGIGGIYVMDGDGRNKRRVTEHPSVNRYPAWSPDGKKIAFESNRNNVNIDHRQIWVIDADGKNPIRLTDGLVDANPDWSPDGTRIVYDAHLVPDDHHLAPGGIAVMDADGKNKRLLTRVGLHPTWSPDGKRIAFISGVDVINHVFVMDVDGRNRMQLTHDFVRKRLPSWSHDGKRIAYVGDNVIWVVDSDGENPRQLTNIVTEEHPTWSPDSESIAFHSFKRDHRGLRGADLVVGIHMVDVTSGDVHALQVDPDFWNLEPDWLYPGGLSVSPEGSRITMWGRLKDIASSPR